MLPTEIWIRVMYNLTSLKDICALRYAVKTTEVRDAIDDFFTHLHIGETDIGGDKEWLYFAYITRHEGFAQQVETLTIEQLPRSIKGRELRRFLDLYRCAPYQSKGYRKLVQVTRYLRPSVRSRIYGIRKRAKILYAERCGPADIIYQMVERIHLQKSLVEMVLTQLSNLEILSFKDCYGGGNVIPFTADSELADKPLRNLLHKSVPSLRYIIIAHADHERSSVFVEKLLSNAPHVEEIYVYGDDHLSSDSKLLSAIRRLDLRTSWYYYNPRIIETLEKWKGHRSGRSLQLPIIALREKDIDNYVESGKLPLLVRILAVSRDA